MSLHLLCAFALALATVPSTTPPADPTEAALLHDIAVLADDAMEGRRPGTPGGDKAVHYIAGEMQAAGLQPGASGDSWYQRVDLLERRPRAAQSDWRVKGHATAMSANELVLLGRSPRLRLDHAALIFAGYGLPPNLEGVDLTDAIVLLLPGTPDMPPFEARRANIAGKGAAAVLTLPPVDSRWQAIRAQYAAGRTTLAGEEGPAITGALSYPAWTRLLQAAGRDPSQLVAAAADPSFRAVPLEATASLRVKTAMRRTQSVNVIGRIPGETRPGEALVTTAHWDHFGICRARSVKDRICNGAVDNASGVATMLESARALARGPRPSRSLFFVATTAEELGLLGARAFVRNPPLPLKSIVAALNLDTVAIAPRGSAVAIIGRGMTRLDPLVDATARALGRKVDAGTGANAYVTRQDGWELMSAGVPAIMVGGAFSDAAGLERFFASRYHGPTDDLSHGLELGGAAEDVALYVALLRSLADPARFPASAR